MDALLLDFNGVVVDDEPLHFASFREVLAEEGIALDEDAYYAGYLGLDDRASVREAFRRVGRPLEPRTAERLVERKAARYGALAARDLVVVPGVGTSCAGHGNGAAWRSRAARRVARSPPGSSAPDSPPPWR